MNALELLKEQHDDVEELFEQFEEAEADSEKQEIFNKIADSLAAHATIEEKLFYPAVYVGELKDLLHEAVEEHLAAKRVIADVMELEPNDESYEAKVKVLKEQIEHHVEEEEGELFPKVKASFSADELSELGEQMSEMFDELMQTEPRAEIPAQTDEAAPLQ
jgi:hemerythrin superfamily protein